MVGLECHEWLPTRQVMHTDAPSNDNHSALLRWLVEHLRTVPYHQT